MTGKTSSVKSPDKGEENRISDVLDDWGKGAALFWISPAGITPTLFPYALV